MLRGHATALLAGAPAALHASRPLVQGSPRADPNGEGWVEYEEGRGPWTWLELAVRFLVPIGAAVIGGWPSGLAALVLQESAFRVARLLAGDATFPRRLFVAAFGTRAALALGLHAYLSLTNGDGAVLQDDYTYNLVAQTLARIARGEAVSVYPAHQYLLENLYIYFLAGIYTVLGPAPLVPKLFNSAVGSLCVVLIAEIARGVFRPAVGRLAGVIAVAFPTFVLWSVVTLKEMLVLFAILASLRAIQLVASPESGARLANAAIGLLATLLLINDLRGVFFLLPLALLPIAVLGRLARRPSRRRILATVAISLVAVIGFVVFSQSRPPETTLNKLTNPDELARFLRQRRSIEATDANSALIGSEIASERDVLAIPTYRDVPPFSVTDDLLRPMATALLSPAPWNVRGPRDIPISVEMVLWYALLGGTVLSVATRPRQPVVAVCLALYGVGTIALLGLAEGNLGNLLRHRMMLAPPVLVLGSAGLQWVWERRRTPRFLGLSAGGARPDQARGSPAP